MIAFATSGTWNWPRWIVPPVEAENRKLSGYNKNKERLGLKYSRAVSDPEQAGWLTCHQLNVHRNLHEDPTILCHGCERGGLHKLTITLKNTERPVKATKSSGRSILYWRSARIFGLTAHENDFTSYWHKIQQCTFLNNVAFWSSGLLRCAVRLLVSDV